MGNTKFTFLQNSHEWDFSWENFLYLIPINVNYFFLMYFYELPLMEINSIIPVMGIWNPLMVLY